MHAMCHAHSYRLSYLWHPILILSTNLFLGIQDSTIFRGILIKILCPFVASSVCNTPTPQPICSSTILPRTCNFHLSVPPALRSSKADTWLSVRQSSWRRRCHYGRTKWQAVCLWVTRSSVHLSVCLCLSSLPSNHELIIPSTCLLIHLSVVFASP
jgi:hypothetical protein